jgi:endo-1,4-beta-D-glucanase Y
VNSNGNGNYAFPQNQAQPYTVHYPTYANQDVINQYNSWYTEQVTTSGALGFQRVQRNGDPTLDANSTVSEGIGYGMVISVYMNDQTLFNNLWQYEQKELDGNGLMNWYINASGTTDSNNGGGAATDADEDMAWALVMAHYQWGDTCSTCLNYSSLATTQINKIYQYEINATTYDVLPGDSWGSTYGNLNPSYFDPSEYRVFAQFTGNTNWLNVASEAYTVLYNSLNATNGNQSNGLDPAWCTAAGVPTTAAFSGAADWYQYDACRAPFRIMKDWAFFGEAKAASYTALTTSFFQPKGAAGIVDGYYLSGTPKPQYDLGGVTVLAASFVGPATCGAMPEGTSGAESFVQDGYDHLITAAWAANHDDTTMLVGGQYYDQCWTVMSLLMMSGNFLNYCPQPTPTPTVDACQSRVYVDCGNTSGSWADGNGITWGADQAYPSNPVLGSYGYLATTSSAGTSSGTFPTGTSDVNLYHTERYNTGTGSQVAYSFYLGNGTATVTMYWAETYNTAKGARVFSVVMNGTTEESALDIFSAAGGENIALVRSYTVPVTNHVLTIVETSSTSQGPTVQAISIDGGPLCTATVTATQTPNWTNTVTPTPSRSPTVSATPTISSTFTMSPTFSPSQTTWPTPDGCAFTRYIDTGNTLSAWTDPNGIVWAQDGPYSTGGYGYLSWSTGTIGTSSGTFPTGTNDVTLYHTERYGSQVGYEITAPNGTDLVTLYWAETYGGNAAAGDRVFSVVLNGTTVESALDIYAATGGVDVALVRSYPVTVTNGTITILETASTSQGATIQAIQVQGPNGCTATITPTYTVSPTFSPSPSLSASPTASSSATPSSTATSTASPSPSATATGSPSATATATDTGTASATRSSTPSSTGSPTASPSGSSTGTISPTWTASPPYSATVTLTPAPNTATPTWTPVLSATSTFSPTATGTSTASASPSLTLTQSPEWTATPTWSVSPQFSATATPTGSSTASGTPTASPSGTPSSTATPSLSASRTASPSTTQTASPSSSASPTATASPTAGGKIPVEPTVTPESSEVSGRTLPVVTGAAMAPNPYVPGEGDAKLCVQLSGPADEVEWVAYNRAMVRVAQGVTGALPGGWTGVELPASTFAGMDGMYFLTVRAGDEGLWSRPKIVKVWLEHE